MEQEAVVCHVKREIYILNELEDSSNSSRETDLPGCRLF
jgi:hypothetical protein